MKISRAKLESLCSDIFDRLIEPCKKAVADSQLSKNQIDEIILVGGSTRIPTKSELVNPLSAEILKRSLHRSEKLTPLFTCSDKSESRQCCIESHK